MSKTQIGYFLTDALGNIRPVADQQTEILLTRDYSPDGKAVLSIGDYKTPRYYFPDDQK